MSKSRKVKPCQEFRTKLLSPLDAGDGSGGGVQLYLTLCDSMNSPPGSSVHGIFQARIPGGGYHFLLQGIGITVKQVVGEQGGGKGLSPG